MTASDAPLAYSRTRNVVLGEVNAALSLWDRLRRWLDTKKGPIGESVATRFVRLLESHGVHRNQIPRFVGHGLTLKDVQTDASLLERLDDSILDAVCTRLAVRREWLDGAGSQIHPCHDFYKYPEEFAAFLDKLLGASPGGQITGVLVASQDADGDGEALIILEETIGAIGDRRIYRYHLLNNWAFSYWRSRVYLTACVAIGWKRHVYIGGITLPSKDINRLVEGTTLLGWQGERTSMLGRKTWYPEDMALEPEAFLKDLDPERDNFGLRSGLELWLELERQGLMDAGINPEQARQKFQRMLSKYASGVSEAITTCPGSE